MVNRGPCPLIPAAVNYLKPGVILSEALARNFPTRIVCGSGERAVEVEPLSWRERSRSQLAKS